MVHSVMVDAWSYINDIVLIQFMGMNNIGHFIDFSVSKKNAYRKTNSRFC
jgi:hypothetical protein